MPRLNVIDRESVCVGHTEAKVGLQTTWGKITRVSDKCVWTVLNGVERCHRPQNSHLPSVSRSHVKDADFITR